MSMSCVSLGLFVKCHRTSQLDTTTSCVSLGLFVKNHRTSQLDTTMSCVSLGIFVKCHRTSQLDMNLSCVSLGIFCSPHCHHGRCRYINGHAGGDLWPCDLRCALQHRGGGMLWTLGAGFKLQALVYYTFPPTAVITGYTVSLRKLSTSSLPFELQWKTVSRLFFFLMHTAIN